MAKLNVNDVTVVNNNVRGRARPLYGNGVRTGSSRKSYNAKTRIYVFAEGETILENLRDRRFRPVAFYREILLSLYPQFKGHINWSQKAGCSCGCSPAFILQNTLYNESGIPYDHFITIGME